MTIMVDKQSSQAAGLKYKIGWSQYDGIGSLQPHSSPIAGPLLRHSHTPSDQRSGRVAGDGGQDAGEGLR